MYGELADGQPTIDPLIGGHSRSVKPSMQNYMNRADDAVALPLDDLVGRQAAPACLVWG